MTDPHDPDCASNPPENGRFAREPRSSVLLNATVEGFGKNAPTRHRVRDLSTGGARIDQAAGLRVGATVLISVGLLQAVGATVLWLKDGLAGLKFAQPIVPEDARAKTAIAPRPARARPRDVLPNAPTAGWIRDLRNPYRKE